MRTDQPGALERGLAGALLNATGLSAGYFYLRRWRWAVASLVVTAALLILASRLTAAEHPVPWLVVFGVWWAWMVAHGWSLGLKVPSSDGPTRLVFDPKQGTARPAGAGDDRDARRWLPFVAAAVLLPAVVLGVVVFRAAAERTYDTAVAAHEEGDCQAAIHDYSRVAGFFQLSFSSVVPAASDEKSACAILVRAEEELGAGNTQRAIELHEDYIDIYDTTPIWAGAEPALAGLRLRFAGELAAAAAESAFPNAEDAYQSAFDAYGVVVEEHPDAPEAEEATAALPPLRLEFAQAFAAYAGEQDGPLDEDAYRGAIDAYVGILEEHPDAPEAEEVRAGLNDLYDSGTAGLGARRYCNAVEQLSFFAGLSGEPMERLAQRAKESLPQALYGCGVRRFDDGELDAAEDLLTTVVDDYPDSARVRDARSVLSDIDDERIKQEIDELLEGDTEELPPPPESGSAPGGTVTVELLNDSPRSLEVLYTGPETGSVSIDACEDCQERPDIDFNVELNCGLGDDVRRLELELEPGTYRMVVRASGGGVIPFSGSWDLASGTAYSDCYYITTQF